jgi:hypothetical protein
MPLNEKNGSRAHVYTWLVLMQLEQHGKAARDDDAVKIKELAFNHENRNDGGRAAAEALASPIMNLFSALTQAELASGMSPDLVKRMLVDVLADGEKTVRDLSTALDACYRIPLLRGVRGTASRCFSDAGSPRTGSTRASW